MRDARSNRVMGASGPIESGSPKRKRATLRHAARWASRRCRRTPRMRHEPRISAHGAARHAVGCHRAAPDEGRRGYSRAGGRRGCRSAVVRIKPEAGVSKLGHVGAATMTGRRAQPRRHDASRAQAPDRAAPSGPRRSRHPRRRTDPSPTAGSLRAAWPACRCGARHPDDQPPRRGVCVDFDEYAAALAVRVGDAPQALFQPARGCWSCRRAGRRRLADALNHNVGSATGVRLMMRSG